MAFQLNLTNSKPVPVEHPFDASPLGVIFNTITGLFKPKTYGTVAKNIVQGTARVGGSIGLGLAEPFTHQETIKPQDFGPVGHKVYTTLFGDEPVHSLAKRVADAEINIQQSPFANKIGLHKFALPLAFAGIVGDATLNLTPFGGEENLIKNLAKTSEPEKIIELLIKANVPENIAKSYATHLAEAGTTKEVHDILTSVKSTLGTEKLTLHEAKFADKAATAEPPKLIENPTQSAAPYPDLIAPEAQSSIDKIKQAISEAEPIRGQQEKLYTEEKARRIAAAGEASKNLPAGEGKLQAQLSQLKGEYPKADYAAIRSKINDDDVKNLFQTVENAPHLDFFDKINAQGALVKMFDGAVPTEGELSLLKQVFPSDLIDTVLSKRSFFEKAKSLGIQLINVPKALRATFDMSAPLRQGLFLSVRNPKEAGKAFGSMIKMFFSEGAYKEVAAEIASRPSYQMMKDAKLGLTNIAGNLVDKEEPFMSNLAEKIPGFGKIVRASDRAYTGFLSKLRADVFDKLIAGAQAVGRDPSTDPKLVQEIGKMVNVFSGRGDLWNWAQKIAPELNGVIFSPRLAASRLTILNPLYYIKADPFVRKEALKTVFTTAAAGLTVLGLASLNKKVKVGTDATSADFGKIKVGNTRFDVWGGTQQYIRMAAQLLAGKYTSTTTGKVTQLNDPNVYKGTTYLDIVTRQLQSKEAPLLSFITDFAKGQDYTGKPVKLSKELQNLYEPLIIQDMIEISKNDPQLLPLSILFGTFGGGVQSYIPTATTTKTKTNLFLDAGKKKTTTPKQKSGQFQLKLK